MFNDVFAMLRLLAKALPVTFHGLHRPSRRTSPLVAQLESRRLLSGQRTDKALVEPVRVLAAGREINTPEAAKTNKQVKFVDRLCEKYLHQAPNSTELSYALELLASGVSEAAFTRDFTVVLSNTNKKFSNQAFTNDLYATIAGHAPTAVGQSYWQGLIASGENRAQVRQMFVASGGLLPPPTIFWVSPASITYGTALGPAQLDATASVPGTFIYSPPRARSLRRAVRIFQSPSHPMMRSTIPPSLPPPRSPCNKQRRRSPGLTRGPSHREHRWGATSWMPPPRSSWVGEL